MSRLTLPADVNFIATSMRTPMQRVQYTRNDTNNALYSFHRLCCVFFPFRRGRARIREISERRGCKHVFPKTRTRIRDRTRTSLPHLVTFSTSVCCVYNTRTHHVSPRTNITRVCHWRVRVSESKRCTERKRERERERKRDGEEKGGESEENSKGLRERE